MDDGHDGGAVFPRLIATIGDLDASTPANIFAIRAFVWVQKPPPAAYVTDQNHAEISPSRVHIAEQFLKPRAPEDRQPALADIRIGLDDLNVALAGVVADLVRLDVWVEYS